MNIDQNTRHCSKVEAEQFVRALYDTILLRPADPDGLNHFVNLLCNTGDFKTVIEALLHSNEFAERYSAFAQRHLKFSVGSGDPAGGLGKGKLTCSGFLFTLEQDGPLGEAGDTILVPTDLVMSPEIIRHAGWQVDDLTFLESKLAHNKSYVLLDIGANIGLCARQFLHRFPSIAICLCVEPDAGNFAALKYNLARFEQSRVRLYPFALGPADGEAEFYRDKENMGNYSLNLDAMRNRPFTSTTASVVSTEPWMRETVPPGQEIIWKSDTQGFDESIIAQTPWDIWNRVCCAIIELWRIQKPAFDIDEFRARIDTFTYKSIGINSPATTKQVLEYLSGTDWSHNDLYLWR